jgi:7,8-dihydropterin-6-yl-methyl-4-(beta-D-ribofuranosyl)aminobenzene 5'-phosphate synthase
MPIIKLLVLPEVERLSITLLMDNYTDRLLPSADQLIIRPPMTKNERFLIHPIAEYGFSALIKVSCNNENEMENTNKISKESSTFLFDCGISENGVIYNADTLGIDFNAISAIILSHGHLDHFAALPNILKKIGTPTRLVCHPDAFLKRWIVFPNGRGRAKMPFLDKEKLERQGAKVIMKQGPSVLSEDNTEDFSSVTNDSNRSSFPLPKILITGQIPRNTLFEKGFPIQYKEDPDENNLVPDVWVNDDQAVVVNIKKQGLVIISGCAHAGIINTINYAKLLTGVDKIFAVIGGFHLTGGEIYDEAIDPTIRELKNANPRHIIPCHCTGWKATNKIIQGMPEKFLQPSVCTTFTFESP